MKLNYVFVINEKVFKNSIFDIFFDFNNDRCIIYGLGLNNY